MLFSFMIPIVVTQEDAVPLGNMARWIQQILQQVNASFLMYYVTTSTNWLSEFFRFVLDLKENRRDIIWYYKKSTSGDHVFQPRYFFLGTCILGYFTGCCEGRFTKNFGIVINHHATSCSVFIVLGGKLIGFTWDPSPMPGSKAICHAIQISPFVLKPGEEQTKWLIYKYIQGIFYPRNVYLSKISISADAEDMIKI